MPKASIIIVEVRTPLVIAAFVSALDAKLWSAKLQRGMQLASTSVGLHVFAVVGFRNQLSGHIFHFTCFKNT